MSDKRMVGKALEIDPNPEFEAKLNESKKQQRRLENPNLLEGPQHVIIGSRQEGKTRLALRWLNSAPEGVERVLIVADTDTAQEMNRDLGLPRRSPRVIAYRTLISQGARKGVEYGLDESVRIIEKLLGLREPLRLITVGIAEEWQTVEAVPTL